MSLAYKRAVEANRRLEGELVLFHKQLEHLYALSSTALEGTHQLKTQKSNFDSIEVYPVECEFELFNTTQKAIAFCQDIQKTAEAIKKLLRELPQAVPLTNTRLKSRCDELISESNELLDMQLELCKKAAGMVESHVFANEGEWAAIELVLLTVKRRIYSPADNLTRLSLIIKSIPAMG